jgi:hypothetical protein
MSIFPPYHAYFFIYNDFLKHPVNDNKISVPQLLIHICAAIALSTIIDIYQYLLSHSTKIHEWDHNFIRCHIFHFTMLTF